MKDRQLQNTNVSYLLMWHLIGFYAYDVTEPENKSFISVKKTAHLVTSAEREVKVSRREKVCIKVTIFRCYSAI